MHGGVLEIIWISLRGTYFLMLSQSDYRDFVSAIDYGDFVNDDRAG
jgi:hypothetical protein